MQYAFSPKGGASLIGPRFNQASAEAQQLNMNSFQVINPQVEGSLPVLTCELKAGYHRFCSRITWQLALSLADTSAYRRITICVQLIVELRSSDMLFKHTTTICYHALYQCDCRLAT